MDVLNLLEVEPKIGSLVNCNIFKELSDIGFSLIRLRAYGKQADREKQWQKYCSNYRKYEDIPRENNENMGIAIGSASNIICIDVDDIILFVNWCNKNNVSLGSTRIHASTKGIHIFYRRWDKMPKINRIAIKNVGLDIMLDKTQVVAPGSVVITDTGRWEYYILSDSSILEAPEWVHKLVSPQREAIIFLEKQWNEIINAPPVDGERNTTLFKILCAARNRGAQRNELIEFAEKYSTFTDLSNREAVKTAESALTKKVNTIEKIKNTNIDYPLKLDVAAMIEGVFDETKVAGVLAEFWYDKYRYCTSNGIWYENRNNIWIDIGHGRSPNPLEPILEYLAFFIYNDDLKDEVIKLYKRYQSFVIHTHLIGFLKNNPLLSISENSFDNNFMTLPLKNAIIEFDIEQITIRPIRWDDFIRKTLPIEWPYQFGIFNLKDLENVFDYDSIKFDDMLDNIFKINIECKNILTRLLGYAISGTNKKIKVLPILIGYGDNGKSVLFRCLQSSFEPLAITVTKNLVLNKGDNDDRPKPEMLILQGARIGLIGESDDNDFINESTVKALTGGDIRSARNLYSKEMIQIKPTYTLFLATNHEPRILGGGKALWDRLLPIPFKIKFTNNPNGIDEVLKDDEIWNWSTKPHLGVLIYLLHSWLDYARNGLGIVPESIDAYKKDYKDEEDQYSEFRDECLWQSLDNDDFISNRDICRAYRNWCNDNQISINSRLSDRSIKRGILNSLREWDVKECFKKISSHNTRGLKNVTFAPLIQEHYASARPLKNKNYLRKWEEN